MPNYQPQLKGLGRVLAGSWSMPVGGFFSYRDYPFFHRPGPPLMFHVCAYDVQARSSRSQFEQSSILPRVDTDGQSSVPHFGQRRVQASGQVRSMSDFEISIFDYSSPCAFSQQSSQKTDQHCNMPLQSSPLSPSPLHTLCPQKSHRWVQSQN